MNLQGFTLTTGDATDTAFAGVISGTGGALTKAGTGTFTISGDNTYSGLTTVSAGTLKLGHLNALGGTVSGTTIQSGATLDLNGAYASANSNESITVSGTGVGGNGAIVNTGAGIANRGFGNLTLAGNTTIGGSVRWDIRGGITFTGNNFTLTKAGSFQMAVSSPLNGADIVLNAGRLTIQTANALGTGGLTDTTTVNSGAILAYYGAYTVPEKIIFNGGSLESENSSTTFSGPITLNATTNVTTAAGGHDITLSGIVDGVGGLTKLGLSTLTLSNANTYAGATAVNAGTLLVNSTHTGGGAYSVASNATLGGTGSTASAVTVSSGGILSPGLASGDITDDFASGNLSLAAGSTYAVQLDSTTVNTGYDQIDVTGTVTLGGNLQLTAGFIPAAGSTFIIINNDGTADAVTGTFSGLAEGFHRHFGGRQTGGGGGRRRGGGGGGGGGREA